MYLPPATPAQAHAVYALLYVSRAAIRLDNIYIALYFISFVLHLVARLLFLQFGLSWAFRVRSVAFANSLLKFGIVRQVQNAGLAVWLFGERLGLPFRPLAKKLQSSKFGQMLGKLFMLWQPDLVRSAFIYYIFYTLLFTALWAPLTIYEDFMLPHQYSLSHQLFNDWLLEQFKDISIDTLIGAGCVSLIVWGIAAFPRRWATIFAALSAPIILISIFLNPLFDRIDNHFTNLPKSSSLYAPLHQLADKAGVPNAVILVADKSKQTEETNAYVTGLGSSAQIVIWDTTIKKMPTDEVVAIIGHELGHYVEHHVIIGGCFAAISMFFVLPLVKWLSELLLRQFGSAWKVKSLGDPAAFPILLISLSILTFLASPITNGASRIIEHRADSYGLAINRNRLAMARAMVDLANENLEDPYPPAWEVFWLDDHPPTGQRIHFALYGQPLEIHR